MTAKIEVWDLPLRLFHWLTVLAVLAAYLTGKFGGGTLADWHGRAGALVMGLLIFRLIWGFAGTTHARFANFFPTPARIKSYLKSTWQGHGHNPLSALSVIALLGLLAAVVTTGLFANDDIAFQGPLFDLVDKSQSDSLSGWHDRIFNLLLLLVVLHVAAIAFYLRVKKTNLVVPMLTGKKSVPKELAIQPASAGLLRFVVAALVSGTVVWGVWSGVTEQQPIPVKSVPAAASAPVW